MKKKNSFIKELFQTIISAVILCAILLKFVLMPCQIHGTSMYPTLQEGQMGYSFICTKLIGIKRFDICIVDLYDTTQNEKYLVKRVIGLPNETITYLNNRLYVDGVYVEEDFLNYDIITEDFTIELGEDEYLCLGDNRAVSLDSRYYGPFCKSQIKATNFFVFYPFNQLGVK